MKGLQSQASQQASEIRAFRQKTRPTCGLNCESSKLATTGVGCCFTTRIFD
jgi:hypothetical protein